MNYMLQNKNHRNIFYTKLLISRKVKCDFAEIIFTKILQQGRRQTPFCRNDLEAIVVRPECEKLNAYFVYLNVAFKIR